MILSYCTPFATQCRFVSHEHMIVTFSNLIEDPRSKRLIVGSVGHRKELIGEYCNNVGKWCNTITQCPARLALVKWCGERASGSGIYPKLVGSPELRELMREKQLGQNTLEGVV